MSNSNKQLAFVTVVVVAALAVSVATIGWDLATAGAVGGILSIGLAWLTERLFP